MELQDLNMASQGLQFERAVALGLKICDGLAASVRSDTQMVTLAIPILSGFGLERVGTGGVEPLLRSFTQVAYEIYRSITTIEKQLQVRAFTHKAEHVEIEGTQWWSKACRSDREASAIIDANQPRQKQKRMYCYLGGGSLSDASSEHVQGIVVRCQTWESVAAAVTAVTLITAACPGHTVVLRRACVTTDCETAVSAGNMYDDAEDAADEQRPGTPPSTAGDVGQNLVDFCEKVRTNFCTRWNISTEELCLSTEKTVDHAYRNYAIYKATFHRLTAGDAVSPGGLDSSTDPGVQC